MSADLLLWCDGPHDVAENMRRDRDRFERFESDGAAAGPAVLRLFAFAPPGITLGHAQRAERELDLARCRADGVAWAMRPTGGRAIFHAEEWTYSLTATLEDPAWGGSLAQSYDRVASVIAAALVRLGVPARLAASSAPAEHDADGRSAACFATPTRHEIVLDGRKLVGSAQRRGRRALLQQGSILLGEGHLRLADYLALPAPERERARKVLERAATHAGVTLGSRAPIARLAEAILAELGPRVRRLEGAPGGFRLTPSKRGSYTRTLSPSPHEHT